MDPSKIIQIFLYGPEWPQEYKDKFCLLKRLCSKIHYCHVYASATSVVLGIVTWQWRRMMLAVCESLVQM